MAIEAQDDLAVRELELELIRTRQAARAAHFEAQAARYEARAAEIELALIEASRLAPASADPSGSGHSAGLMLPPSQRVERAAYPICGDPPGDPAASNSPMVGSQPIDQKRRFAAEELIAAIRRVSASSDPNPEDTSATRPTPISRAYFEKTPPRAVGWAERLRKLEQRHQEPQPSERHGDTLDPLGLPQGPSGRLEQGFRAEHAARGESHEGGSSDSAQAGMPAAEAAEASQPNAPQSSPEPPDPVVKDRPAKKPDAKEDVELPREATAPVTGKHANEGVAPTAKGGRRRKGTAPPSPIPDLELQDNGEIPRRFRPGAIVASLGAHAAALFGLAMLTLSLPKARDQLGFTASASQSSQEPVATFTVEPSTEITSSQPVPSDDAPVEPSVESEVSEVAIAEVASAVAASSLPAQAAVVNEGSAANLAGSQLSRSNELKVQFAGIEGGGNHFVYLVDSSNSMRNFNEARAELLRSVDALQPDQRFYVVFYDQNPTHMRISAADEDDASSMLATPENKLVLRRWAMTIRQEKGKSPVETLRFAFGLEPDVIFLLSDGEFSAETEEVIRELNQRENLFGESQLATIIHTIRYPGYAPGEATKAEAQMRRIAGENGGQYRNIVLE
jgi:hypothetical protein